LPQLHAVCDRNIPFKTLIFTCKIIPFPHFFSILFTSWRYPPSVSFSCWNLKYFLTSAAYYLHHEAASSNVNFLFVIGTSFSPFFFFFWISSLLRWLLHLSPQISTYNIPSLRVSCWWQWLIPSSLLVLFITACEMYRFLHIKSFSVNHEF
jgi:hypothetical protein